MLEGVPIPEVNTVFPCGSFKGIFAGRLKRARVDGWHRCLQEFLVLPEIRTRYRLLSRVESSHTSLFRFAGYSHSCPH